MSIVRPVASLKTISHLLLAGNNCLSPPIEYASRSQQQPSNSSLTVMPFSLWLGSIGRADDVEKGWQIVRGGLGAGYGHTLIAYKSGGKDRVDRVFAAGRNESSQLGIGYASQEGTRNLVQGFKGDSIVQAACSLQSSYLLIKNFDSTSLYVSGSLQRGRLSQPKFFDPELIPDDKEPVPHQISQATLVELPDDCKTVKELATGFEHAILLTSNGTIYGTGANTDGQLGLGETKLSDTYEFTKVTLPAEINELQGGVARIRAGADTSGLITKAGRVWTWGNSEYGQALHGYKIDQIAVPKEIDSSFLPPSRRIVDFHCGGSYTIVLDNKGSVYSAGFGALGLGKETLESQMVRRIDSLEGEGITRIRADYGGAIAIRDDGDNTAIFAWGLNNHDGRLGVGNVAIASTAAGALAEAYPSDKRSLRGIRDSSVSRIPIHIYEPTKLVMPLKDLKLGEEDGPRWMIGEVECGEEALWVEIIQEVV